MEVLQISGVIGRKTDPGLKKGEAVFSFQDLQNFLDTYGGGPFRAVINSPGGSVDEGFEIYNELLKHEVHTEARQANSIASVIFSAGKTRKVFPGTEMIIHNAWVDGAVLTGENLNFYSLKGLADEFAKTDLQILKVYTGIAGEDKAGEILALMAKETNLGADKALSLGLATEIVEQNEAVKSLQNRVITYSRNQIQLIEQQIKEEMDNKEKISGFEKALKGLKNFFSSAFKNMAVMTTDGTALFIGGDEEADLIGRPVYLAVDGLPSDEFAPAGSHTLEDGKTITVDESGIITEVQEPEEDPELEDVAALKAAFEKEKEDLKAAYEEEKKDLKAQIANLTKSNSEAGEKLNKLVKDFEGLKNQVMGDPDQKKGNPKQLSREEFAKLIPSERIRLQAMNKAVQN